MPFSADDAQKMLANAFAKSPEDWMAAVNTILVDLVGDQHKARVFIGKKLVPVLKDHAQIFDVLKAKFGGAADEIAPEVSTAETPAASPGPPVGADGAPLSVEQVGVEAMMDAAAGPRDGEAPVQPAGAPVPIAQRLRVPPKGGARGGAPTPAPAVAIKGDGSDEDQAKLEAMMNQAAGPRQ